MYKTKLVSFNINGLRAHLHQLEAIIVTLKPDIIGLQEIKIDNSIFPYNKIQSYGYYTSCYGQKGHYGVAILSKTMPLFTQYGLGTKYTCTEERRIMISNFMTSKGMLTVINGYFPQGDNRNHQIKFPAKQQFYHNLQNYIAENYDNKSLLLIMGDMNISPTDLDIGIGRNNSKRWLSIGKCSFLPEERTWMNKLLKWGLIDIYRYTYPVTKNRYSWFDYRSNGFSHNKGLRIDLLLASKILTSFVQDTGINYDIRAMYKPSDHAPIWASFLL